MSERDDFPELFQDAKGREIKEGDTVRISNNERRFYGLEGEVVATDIRGSHLPQTHETPTEYPEVEFEVKFEKYGRGWWFEPFELEVIDK